MRSAPIPAKLFSRNRSRLADQMAPESVCVICSADRVPSSGDQFYPFRQLSNFFYLTGINQDGCTLMLFPGHRDPTLREILFIPESDPKTELWSGPGISAREAALLSGIEHVKRVEEMEGILERLAGDASKAYLNHDGQSGETGRIRTANELLYRKIVTGYPGLSIEGLSPLVTRLRMIKEYEELEEIKKAASITGSAFGKVLRTVKPGIREYEIEAEITAEFIRRGAEGHAFDPIVACGENALILHYSENSAVCKKGEMLLMDFGARVNNYSADCSRTIPVSGRFSGRQRQVYESLIRIFRQAKEWMKPGVLLADFNNRVGAMMEEEHIGLGLYSPKQARDPSQPEPLWKKYFMHGTTHSLGLDVHDPFDRSVPFQPGMVLTLEPAVYIPEEGMGIRLENDILITADGAMDLMEAIPLEVEEIESAMLENH